MLTFFGFPLFRLSCTIGGWCVPFWNDLNVVGLGYVYMHITVFYNRDRTRGMSE